jgi:hypothetical protein
LKLGLGHDGPPRNYWRDNLVTGEPLTRCPLRTLQLARETDPALSAELDRHIDTYYPAYKAGHLLEDGGIGQQPARYIALVQRIDAIDTKTDERYREIKQAESD